MAGLGGIGGIGGGRGDLPLNAEINVTSLVDVMLVLLIVFMITAPMMQGGVDVQLPRAEARPLEPKEGLVVTVDRAGRVFVDQTAVSYDDFRVTFASLVAARKPSGVYLRADNGAYLDAGAPGSGVTVQNSRCSLDGASSSVSGSGTDVTVNFRVTFKVGFIGGYNLILRNEDINTGQWSNYVDLGDVEVVE